MIQRDSIRSCCIVLTILAWVVIIVVLCKDKHKPAPEPSPVVVLVGGDEYASILRLNNFVIGAFVDGTLCYGTHEPRETVCKQAVSKPDIELE